MLNDSSDNKWKIVTWSRCSKLGFEISRKGYHRIIKLRKLVDFHVSMFLLLYFTGYQVHYGIYEDALKPLKLQTLSDREM